MISIAHIKELHKAYLALFPEERERIDIFTRYLDVTPEGQQFSRKNFTGHITASAFIINNENEILLLRHKALQRWLQPGGHVEEDGNLLTAALREAVEETGIAVDALTVVNVHADQYVPFDIDPHYIPANPRKDEAGHYHHDVRYLFRYTGQRELVFNEEEASGLKWVRFDELTTDDTFGKIIEKICRFI